MPVLAALGQLRIDPAVAEKVLRAALEVRSSSCQQTPACGMEAAVSVLVHRDPSMHLRLADLADKYGLAPAQALPMLSEAELPPAVGLVLKLASESPLARAPAVSTAPAQRSAAPELVLKAAPLCKLCQPRLGGVLQPTVIHPLACCCLCRCGACARGCAAPLPAPPAAPWTRCGWRCCSTGTWRRRCWRTSILTPAPPSRCLHLTPRSAAAMLASLAQ
jgi:hypothetical protein